jgi:hypothetical protein
LRRMQWNQRASPFSPVPQSSTGVPPFYSGINLEQPLTLTTQKSGPE